MANMSIVISDVEPKLTKLFENFQNLLPCQRGSFCHKCLRCNTNCATHTPQYLKKNYKNCNYRMERKVQQEIFQYLKGPIVTIVQCRISFSWLMIMAANSVFCSNIIHYQLYSLQLSCLVITNMRDQVLSNKIQASQGPFPLN